MTLVRKKAVFGALASAALLLGTAMVLLSPATALTNCSVSGADATTDAEEHQMLVLINQYRADNNKNPLSSRSDVSRAAAWFSRDMATKSYFPDNHVDSLGRGPGTRLTQCDVPYTRYAENIAAGNESARETFGQWRNSPPHDANMLLDGVTFAGIGRAFDATSLYGWYWTLDLTATQTAASSNSTSSTVVTTSTPTTTATTSTTSTPTTTPTTSTAPATPSTTTTVPQTTTLPTTSTVPSTTSTVPSTTSTTPTTGTTPTTSITAPPVATIATSGEPSTPEPCAHLEAQRATAHASFDRAEAALLSLSGAQGTAFIEQVAEQRARLNAYFSALQAVCDPTSAADTVPAAHGHVDG